MVYFTNLFIDFYDCLIDNLHLPPQHLQQKLIELLYKQESEVSKEYGELAESIYQELQYIMCALADHVILQNTNQLSAISTTTSPLTTTSTITSTSTSPLTTTSSDIVTIFPTASNPITPTITSITTSNNNSTSITPFTTSTSSAIWWSDNLLEEKLFKTRIAGDKIFDNIDKLLTSTQTYKINLFPSYLYLLSLDFKGKYNFITSKTDQYKSMLFDSVYNHKPELHNLHNQALDNIDIQSIKLDNKDFYQWIHFTLYFTITYITLIHCIWLYNTFGLTFNI